jgi:hypothetical protein
MFLRNLQVHTALQPRVLTSTRFVVYFLFYATGGTEENHENLGQASTLARIYRPIYQQQQMVKQREYYGDKDQFHVT